MDQGGWDVVLSDYNVPGLDFATTFEVIRQKFPDQPVILVSGSIGEEVAVDLLKNGLCDFVLKDRLHRLVPAIERSQSELAEKQRRRAAETKLANNLQLMHAVPSSTASVIARQGVLDEGVHFMQKPFSSKSLAAKVQEVLQS